jgi:diacylglycerol kinase family enzyme
VDGRTGGLLVVVNPHTLHGPCAEGWRDALARLRSARPVACVETVGDGADGERIGTAIAAGRPAIVVAGGGDGTVCGVAGALLDAAPSGAPALAILPFGTANNVARSLGLTAIRQHGAAAVQCAVDAILTGVERPLDLGRVGGRVFVGSFAVGMDAAILSARNRWRRRWRLGPGLGGYPLYLVSCAVNLARRRSAAGRFHIDGSPGHGAVYNLLVLNTALYAGEFRFDAADHSADGRLDLHTFSGPADYVRGFVGAWRRHLRYSRGLPADPPTTLRRVEQVELTLARALSSQLDGEESEVADRFEVRVLPHAIRVRVPSTVQPAA